MTLTPMIASAEDLPDAIRFATLRTNTRWYVTKRAEALGCADQIPAEWNLAVVAAADIEDELGVSSAPDEDPMEAVEIAELEELLRTSVDESDEEPDPEFAFQEDDMTGPSPELTPVLASISQKQRDEAAHKGTALSDGSFPIRNRAELQNAVQAMGRAGGNKSEAEKKRAVARVKRHIIKRARAMKAMADLPDSWGITASAGEYALTAAFARRAEGDVGAAWNEALHPRGRDGKYITSGGSVNVYENQASKIPSLRGDAIGVREENGDSIITVKATHAGFGPDGEPVNVGDHVDVSSHQVANAPTVKAHIGGGTDVPTTPPADTPGKVTLQGNEAYNLTTGQRIPNDPNGGGSGASYNVGDKVQGSDGRTGTVNGIDRTPSGNNQQTVKWDDGSSSDHVAGEDLTKVGDTSGDDFDPTEGATSADPDVDGALAPDTSGNNKSLDYVNEMAYAGNEIATQMEADGKDPNAIEAHLDDIQNKLDSGDVAGAKESADALKNTLQAVEPGYQLPESDNPATQAEAAKIDDQVDSGAITPAEASAPAIDFKTPIRTDGGPGALKHNQAVHAAQDARKAEQIQEMHAALVGQGYDHIKQGGVDKYTKGNHRVHIQSTGTVDSKETGTLTGYKNLGSYMPLASERGTHGADVINSIPKPASGAPIEPDPKQALRDRVAAHKDASLNLDAAHTNYQAAQQAKAAELTAAHPGHKVTASGVGGLQVTGPNGKDHGTIVKNSRTGKFDIQRSDYNHSMGHDSPEAAMNSIDSPERAALRARVQQRPAVIGNPDNAIPTNPPTQPTNLATGEPAALPHEQAKTALRAKAKGLDENGNAKRPISTSIASNQLRVAGHKSAGGEGGGKGFKVSRAEDGVSINHEGTDAERNAAAASTVDHFTKLGYDVADHGSGALTVKNRSGSGLDSGRIVENSTPQSRTDDAYARAAARDVPGSLVNGKLLTDSKGNGLEIGDRVTIHSQLGDQSGVVTGVARGHNNALNIGGQNNGTVSYRTDSGQHGSTLSSRVTTLGNDATARAAGDDISPGAANAIPRNVSALNSTNAEKIDRGVQMHGSDRSKWSMVNLRLAAKLGDDQAVAELARRQGKA